MQASCRSRIALRNISYQSIHYLKRLRSLRHPCYLAPLETNISWNWKPQNNMSFCPSPMLSIFLTAGTRMLSHLSHVHMAAIPHPEPDGMPKLFLWDSLFYNMEFKRLQIVKWRQFYLCSCRIEWQPGQEAKKGVPCRFDAEQWFLYSLLNFSIPLYSSILSCSARNNLSRV